MGLHWHLCLLVHLYVGHLCLLHANRYLHLHLRLCYRHVPAESVIAYLVTAALD
jgi:hypothetical protein